MNTLCPHCKLLIPYSARQAGRPAMCPFCHERFEMPTPDEQARLIEQEDALKQEQMQRFEHARQRRASAAAESGRYPALRIIAGLLQFLAILLFVASLIGLAVVVFGDVPWEAKIGTLISSPVTLLLAPVLLWGLGELILLFVDMANDARAARQEITRLRRKRT